MLLNQVVDEIKFGLPGNRGGVPIQEGLDELQRFFGLTRASDLHYFGLHSASVVVNLLLRCGFSLRNGLLLLIRSQVNGVERVDFGCSVLLVKTIILHYHVSTSKVLEVYFAIVA